MLLYIINTYATAKVQIIKVSILIPTSYFLKKLLVVLYWLSENALLFHNYI